jgi:hypothetical protein
MMKEAEHIGLIILSVYGVVTLSATTLWLSLEFLFPFKCQHCKKYFMRFRLGAKVPIGSDRHFFCKKCYLLETMRHKEFGEDSVQVPQFFDVLQLPLALLLYATGTMKLVERHYNENL